MLYTAINIPVARVVATPLTRPMLRAARGPLADSMLLYVTLANFAIVLSMLAAAALLPRLLRRVPRIWIIAVLPFALLGPAAGRHTDTRGMDRNAVTALIGSRVPPASADPAARRLAKLALPAPLRNRRFIPLYGGRPRLQRGPRQPGIHRRPISRALWRK